MSPRAAVLLEEFGFKDVYDYIAGKADWLAHDLPVEESKESTSATGELTRIAETCRLNEQASVVACRLEETEDTVSVVVDDSNVVLGLVNMERLVGNPDQDIREIMELGPSTFRPDADPGDPLDYMNRNDVDHVVVTRPDGELIGVVERTALEQIMSDTS